MSRFRDQLLELGKYSDDFPNAKLVFEVPISSLQENKAAETYSIQGSWKATLKGPDGSIMECDGPSGEVSLEWLIGKIREMRKNRPSSL